MTFNFLIICSGIVTGTIGFISGMILKKNPPKNISWWYGYKSKRAMENQEKWNYAQVIAAENMMKYSSIPFLTIILGFFIDRQHFFLSLGIVLVSSFFMVLYVIYMTETKLKSEFDKKEK